MVNDSEVFETRLEIQFIYFFELISYDNKEMYGKLVIEVS